MSPLIRSIFLSLAAVSVLCAQTLPGVTNQKANQLLWNTYSGGPIGWNASPVLADSSVYVASSAGKILALDSRTGEIRWEKNIGVPTLAAPCVANGRVFFGSSDYYVFALDALTGQEIWRFSTTGSILTTPASYENNLYVTSRDQHLYALNQETGQVIWRFKAGGPIDSSPAATDHSIYFGCWDRHVYAIDKSNGILCWKFQTANRVVASPVVKDGVIYIGSRDQTFYAIDEHMGSIKWKFRTDGPIDSRADVYSGLVYFGSGDQFLYAVDQQSGRVLWRFRTGGKITGGVSAQGGLVAVGVSDGVVDAFEPKTGELVWQFLTNGGIESPPVISDNRLYCTSQDGYVYSIGKKTEKIVTTTAAHFIEENLLALNQSVWVGVAGVSGPVRCIIPASNGKVLYAANEDNGVLISKDRGNSWTPLSSAMPPEPFRWLAIDFWDELLLYAISTFGSVFRSNDGGNTWVNLSEIAGLTGEMIRSILSLHQAKGSLLLATENGLYLSQNRGDNWTQITLPLTGKLLQLVSPSIPSHTIYLVNENAVLRSKDAGISWHKFLGDKDIVWIDSPRYDALFAISTSKGLLRSFDDGATWQVLAPELFVGKDLHMVHADPQNPGKIAIVTKDNMVWRSLDNGLNWEALGYGLSTSDEKDSEILSLLWTINNNLLVGTSYGILELGTVIEKNTLGDILFDIDSDILRPDALLILDRIIDQIKADSSLAVRLEGFTDNQGPIEYNLELSRRRAQSIEEYLRKNGISKDYIFSFGYGESRPRSLNDTEEGRKRNRRVEVFLIQR